MSICIWPWHGAIWVDLMTRQERRLLADFRGFKRGEPGSLLQWEWVLGPLFIVRHKRRK